MPGAFLFRDGKILVARPAKNAAELPDVQGLFESASVQDQLIPKESKP
jgi:hypothetical protein